MPGGISTILRISRLTNNLRENGYIRGMDDQSIVGIEGLPIFEEEYTNGISDPNIPALTVSSISIRSNSFILKMFREIVQINFSHYIFFCFRRRITRSFTSSSSASIQRCWIEMARSCLNETSRILQSEQFFRIHSIK